MADSYGNKPFGLRDVKLTNDTPTQVDLPAARVLSFKERMRSNEVGGDDKLVSVVAFTEAVEWSLEEGGIDLAAYALITGRTASESGTTPSRTNTLTGQGADCMPWIKVYGKVISDDCDSDIHCKILKAKVTNIEGEFKEGEFWITKCEGIGIDDGTTGIFQFVENETADDLPAS